MILIQMYRVIYLILESISMTIDELDSFSENINDNDDLVLLIYVRSKHTQKYG